MSLGFLARRGSEEFPRAFVPKDSDLGDWDQIAPLLAQLEERPLGDSPGFERWLLDLSELQAVIWEEGSRRYIAMTCHTDDESHERRYLEFIEKIEPRLKPVWDRLNRKALAARGLISGDGERYSVFLRAIENEVKLFRENNVPLQTEDEKLRQQYQKICGAMTVQFRGEERTLPQMRRYLEETDRTVRQEAWEKMSERYLADREALEEIFDNMIAIRHRMACNAGYGNYRDYQHQALGRFDYTPDDCIAFQEAVEAEIVPLLSELAERRKQDLGLDSLRPWDLQVDPKGLPPLRPFETAARLEEGCARIFHRIHPALGEQFERMRTGGLLDLDSRKGKAPGGYQSTLEELRLPFIFMNAVGTDRDLETLLHEGGHAFHAFACREEPLVAYRSAPIEFCEVASMSMELLAMPHIEEFYSSEDAARSRRMQIERTIEVLPWIATIDAFQHWVYLHPRHTHEERAEAWLSIRQRFSQPVDWSGYEESCEVLWHRQLHPFTCPLYYIEYGIAQIGALQLWLKSLEDREAALAGYRHALALGGSRPLPELFSAAGLRFAFDRETLAPLGAKLRDAVGV
ncbi:MAG: M3 family oligoendopeptidase [Candidatus Omnitrophica bacterium]|nr:M3 family oligoendopeptidase [Candidatus Omnitrophota bacterium]